MNTLFRFKITSEAEFLAAKAYFLALGFQDEFNNYNYGTIVKYKYLNFIIDTKKNRIYGIRDSSPSLDLSSPILFQEIFNIKSAVVKVELNKDYTAEVSKTEIKVGCQTFPLDIIEKLADARNQVLQNTNEQNYSYFRYRDNNYLQNGNKYLMVRNNKTKGWSAVYFGESVSENEKEGKFIPNHFYDTVVKDGKWIETVRPAEIRL